MWLAKENEVVELDQVLEEKMNAEEKDCPLERPGDQGHDAPNLWNFLLRTTTN